ncbi:uncharacterized protein LOC112089787 [Eutrema salsugineum]|uniref:uncharacterized protein LOC112089787 n=1 Tax=Eutrema salsugineum TaxID=72664 RepID=UPI000CED1E7A|nr:uncharacterized protein LOC112089787 [Eutrema salsugineum]
MSNIKLPERLFAAGQEPVGERVNSYQKSKSVQAILNALDEDEVKRLRDSQMGKLLATMDMPSFSGSFGFYMLARLLRVKKKHELWFLFAGRPIRFSLREFAIVTGLECGKFAQTRKLKNLVAQKPYWPELFGVGFDLLVSSIKSKDELELSQKTIAVKGFFYAIQLVMMAAVPTLTEVVQDPSGESDSDCDDESDTATDVASSLNANRAHDRTVDTEGVTATGAVKMMLSPSHAREIDEEEQAIVHSIIPNDGDVAIEGMDLRWTDEVADEAVDIMVKLIGEGFRFTKDMFSGGLSAADLARMRSEKALKEKETKDKKKKDKTAESSSTSVSLDQDAIADLVVDKLKSELQSFNNRLRDLEASVLLQDGKIVQAITAAFKSFHDSIVRSISQQHRVTHGVSEERGFPTHFDDDNTVTQHPPSSVSPTATVADSGTEHVFIDTSIGHQSVSVSTIQTQSASYRSSALNKPPPLAMSNDEFLRQLTQSINAQSQDVSRFSTGLAGINVPQCQTNPMVSSTVIVSTNPVTAENYAFQPSPQNQLVLYDNQANHQSVNGIGSTKAMDLLLSVSPSFSLGLTQDDLLLHPEAGISNVNVTDNNPFIPRKSKRLKTSSVVYKDYQCGLTKAGPPKMTFIISCDPNINYSARFAELKAKISHDRRPIEIYPGVTLESEDVIAIGERIQVLQPKVVDPIMFYLRNCSGPQQYPLNYSKIEFFDTSFPMLIKSQYAKFTRTAVKDRSKFKFQDSLMSYFSSENPRRPLPESMYFPFNLDKRHWVGVCVNICQATIFVLDCNVSLRSDSALKKEFIPICNVFPFLLRAASTKVLRDEKPYALERVTGIPQNEINSDSAVTALLLMQAHASVGLEGCRSVTPELVSSEAYKLAVMFYNEFGPNT